MPISRFPFFYQSNYYNRTQYYNNGYYNTSFRRTNTSNRTNYSYEKNTNTNHNNNLNKNVKSEEDRISKDIITQKNNSKSSPNQDSYFFELFGLKLYFDDILLICLIFFLYEEGVKDDELFISLILLLLS